MKKLKLLTVVLLLAAVLTMGAATPAAAAGATTWRGFDYSSVFDAGYYSGTYPDLRAAFGGNSRALFNHFITCGMNEGRSGSGDFDFWYYYNLYPDLRAAFGDNKPAYYQHYASCGRYEGRSAVADSIYGGVDYSSVYDVGYYYNTYSDLRAAFGYNPRALISHFVNCGMSEGRIGNTEFNPYYYRMSYSDLRAAFGQDLRSYYNHYIYNGRFEGRTANKNTIYDGVDYASVYNPDYYYCSYSDLRAAFGYNQQLLLEHFVTNGMQEGRIGNENFNVYEFMQGCSEEIRTMLGSNCRTYYYYYLSGGNISNVQMRGMDVSAHQGVINWDQVKASGIQFAIIRLGYGDNEVGQDDKRAEYNMKECERLGIPYGVYLYSYATALSGEHSADSEAAHTLRVLGNHQPKLGVWYDIEDSCQNGLSNDELTDLAIRYLDTIRSSGHEVGIYANLNMWNTRLHSDRLDAYSRWVAHWTSAANCGYGKNYVMWQYTSDGSVNGIDGRVDLNIYYIK